MLARYVRDGELFVDNAAPLILVRAVLLGCLLPATDDAAADLDIFLKLMAMDDAAFGRRFDGSAAEFTRMFPAYAELATEERAAGVGFGATI
jgi:putative DNA methylase